nr:uncharacterized protein LOC118879086 [Drosophila suzukii]
MAIPQNIFIPLERNTPSATSLPTSTSCRACPCKKKLSIGELLDPTSTSYLAANAVMEDALASKGRWKNQPRSQSSSHFLKVQYPYWDSETEFRWRGKDGEASVGQRSF